MKAYRFPLERVLSLRALEEERARQAVRLAEGVLEEALVELRSLDEERARRQGDVARLRCERPLPLDRLLGEEDALAWIAGCEDRARHRREAAEHALAVRRTELRLAHQRVEGLSRLRARRAAEHVKQVLRRTELLMDDLVAGRQGRIETFPERER